MARPDLRLIVAIIAGTLIANAFGIFMQSSAIFPDVLGCLVTGAITEGSIKRRAVSAAITGFLYSLVVIFVYPPFVPSVATNVETLVIGTCVGMLGGMVGHYIRRLPAWISSRSLPIIPIKNHKRHKRRGRTA